VTASWSGKNRAFLSRAGLVLNRPLSEASSAEVSSIRGIWDSLKHVELVQILEEIVEHEISDSEFDRLESIGDFLDVIAEFESKSEQSC